VIPVDDGVGAAAVLPRRLRILHLEDNPADAELIRSTLESEGTVVEALRVETHEDFVAALGREAFDIVLSDYALPTFDGIAAARELRRLKVDVPMIMISGTLGEERAVEALKAGATDFLGKQHLARIPPAVARAIEEARVRKSAAQALRESEAKLMRAQRMESLGILAGGVAHDLNNILAPILMAVDVLRRKSLDDQSRRLVAAMEASARRGADLVRQVLTFARGVEGARAPLQLRQVLSEMERMMRETFPRSLEVRTDVAADLWPVMGQSTPLQQVVMNLCVNARDAMPNGGILTVSAGNVLLDDTAAVVRHPLARPGPYVRLGVADTGEGIAPEVLERIFDPFYTTKPVGHGTGLGLSTSLSIVTGHGGFIDVASDRGRGTTFHVYLPALPGAVEAAAAALPAEPAGGTGELVLVVDDEASIREMTREVLEEFGFAVVTAGSGSDAIAVFRERRAEIRVIVTDLAMPEMDGASLVRALREIDAAVAIIISSGLIEGTPLETGADALLSKPYTASQLVELVRSLALRPR
jgi:signal transduction histidine kinase